MIKTFRAVYEVEGVGSFVGKPVQSNFHSNHAYFCKTCGSLWGRIKSEDPFATWMMHNVPCEQHLPIGVEDWSAFPGSLLHPRVALADTQVTERARAIESLPDELLEREFKLHLGHFNKLYGDSNEQTS